MAEEHESATEAPEPGTLTAQAEVAPVGFTYYFARAVLVPLTRLIYRPRVEGRGNIPRKDHKRVVTISGDIEQRSVDAVLGDIRKIVNTINLPPGYQVTYSGENKDMVESGTFLAILLGTILGGTLIALGAYGAHSAAALCFLIAVLGYVSSRGIPPAPPPEPQLRINWNPFMPYLI